MVRTPTNRIRGLFHPPRRPPTAPLPEPSTHLSTARAVHRDEANPTRQRALLRALEHQRVENRFRRPIALVSCQCLSSSDETSAQDRVPPRVFSHALVAQTLPQP